MTEEIIENYPVTPDMRTPTQKRRRWNFARFNIDTAWKTTDHEAWKKAAQAARQTTSRTGFRFAIKWSADNQMGLIVRVE